MVIDNAREADEPRLLDEDDGIDLREYLGLLLDNWLLVVVIVALALAIGAYMAWTAPAVYTARALVQIEQSQQSAGGSGDSLRFGMNSPFGLGMSKAAAETEILKSRSVSGDAVDALNMTVVAAPDYLGAFGRAWARGQPEGAPATPPLGMDWLRPYAWGGELIQLDRLSVPDALFGYPFTLVAGAGGAYELRGVDGEKILEGQVDNPAQGRFKGHEVSLFVARMAARPGTHFIIFRRREPAAVGALVSSLTVQEAGSGTGVLNLSLTADDPDTAERRLDAITEAYLKQNVERQSEQAQQSLTFLREQLPKQRREVDEAESRLREYQSSKGTVDLSMEAQAVLDQSAQIERRLSELELQRAELLQEYTRQSPQYEALMVKRRQLQQEKANIEAKLKKLPRRQSEFLELQRDAKVANELYVQMLNRVQELQITKAGVTGFVRIIDSAYAPNDPTGPNRKAIVFVALLLGLAAAFVIVLVKRALKRTISDPAVIEKKYGVPVYATVPFSRSEQRLSTRREQKSFSTEPSVLAHEKPHDVAVESVRSLRTSLQFAFLESDNNILSISSPTPECGKSFVSANLAYLLAEANQRVLLVDADMRKGYLHKQFGVSFAPGLSAIITGKVKQDEAVVSVYDGKMDFLPAGVFPPNPSELLLHERFHAFLAAVRADYDVVILDTPPLMNVTDGIIVAKEAGTTFLVARSEHTTLHEIESASARLHQNRIRLSGAVFNGLRLGAGRYGYGNYRYYGYEYKAST